MLCCAPIFLLLIDDPRHPICLHTGYPIGGDTVSVTAGVVSRVEMMPYSHGQAELLGVQVDSAINPGNSGGPAFNDQRQVVGVAFQGLAPTEAEAIGYIIPWVVVSHFLDDVERHGRYTGFCYAGFEWGKVRRRGSEGGWRRGGVAGGRRCWAGGWGGWGRWAGRAGGLGGARIADIMGARVWRGLRAALDPHSQWRLRL